MVSESREVGWLKVDLRSDITICGIYARDADNLYINLKKGGRHNNLFAIFNGRRDCFTLLETLAKGPTAGSLIT